MSLLYTLAKPTSFGTVNPSVAGPEPAGMPAACDDINRCRTIPNILWNCFSLVFICTWVAIHPNVPKVGKHIVEVIRDYVFIMVVALIAPELIILWAMRQWYAAHEIANKYKDYDWGLCNAYLVIMGGFALYDGEKFVRYIWDREGFDDDEIMIAMDLLRETVSHDERKEVEQTANRIRREYQCLLRFLLAKGFITTTEDEVRCNLNHGDALSKLIAVLQTAWFITQCIARATEGVAITQIEIITLALAVLNFVTYYMWWHKPLRVRFPVRVIWKRRDRPENISLEHFWVATRRALFNWHNDEWYHWIFAPLLPLLVPVIYLFKNLYNIVAGEHVDTTPKLFASSLTKDPPQVYATVYLVAFVFGGMHCIPWFFTFPTHAEKIAWRICALVVTLIPFGSAFFHFLHGKDFKIPDNYQVPSTCPLMLKPFLEGLIKMAGKILDHSWIFLYTLFAILHTSYVVARFTMLVLALLEFRNLPPSAYQAVQWSVYIPHIG
ncbi:hypothetical protein Moror_2003 [Moniliophthora roreri MCA 2997]|uniref:Uncharacterized protein n=1 Tax=Moniliophthora roreri (strain MCA 2997) TaxID=1381753 RepID=V2Y7A4_MONRO|nr:hypothetical protein Moror_2003 [Moniliophthora roreri MCA 2997]